MSLRELDKEQTSVGYKADGDKPRVDLLPARPLFIVAGALYYHSQADQPPNRATLEGNALSHLYHWWSGEDHFVSSNLHHLAHALAEVMALYVSDTDGSPLTWPAGYDPTASDFSKLAKIPRQALDGAARVFGFGARKYSESAEAYRSNWLQGMRWGRMYAAALRHLYAYHSGERLDSDSGLPHLAHAMCDLLMLLEYATNRRYAHLDDRPLDGRLDRLILESQDTETTA